MDEAPGGKKRLTLIRSPAPEDEKLLSPEEFFKARVLPSLKEMALIMTGEEGSADYYSMEVPDRVAPGLKDILASIALEVPVFENLIDKSAWREGKIVLRVVENYSCHVLVARDGDDMELDQFAPGMNYFYETEQFAGDDDEEEDDDDAKKYKPYWEIIKNLETKKGAESGAAINIIRVHDLIRSLLYEVELKEEKRGEMAAELVELRMKVGEAARLVIADFITDYDAGKGWVHVVDVDVSDIVFDGKSAPYLMAMTRLQISNFDLFKLC